MPSVTLNRKVFEKLIGKKLSNEKLKDRISMLGTDLEKIDKNEIEVEVFPNRPDMLSEQGFARAFSSFIGVKKGLREYKVKKSNEKIIIDKGMEDVRPYTACAIIKNLKFDDEKIKEVIQIQEKLHVTFGRNRKKAAIGIYPIEKIEFPVRFTCRKPGDIRFRPLESIREMTGGQIIRDHPTGRDYGHLVANLERWAIFIDNKDQILSLTPIINSHLTGKITEDTKEVFVECSGFDFKVMEECLNILVTALADMGGEIYSLDLEYPKKKVITPNLKPSKMRLDLDYVNKLLGLNLKEKDVKNYLEKMGYDYNNGRVLVPSYRVDVLHMIDLVEDISIAYGYENFKEEIPSISTIAEEDEFYKFKERIANFLVGFKLLETSSYHLLSKEDIKNYKDVDVIEISNSNSEYSVLRPLMLPSLLKVLSENRHYEYPQRIFEVGYVFSEDNKEETNIKEDSKLGLLSCHNKANFTEVKQILDSLFSHLDLDLDYKIEEEEGESFISGRVGKIIIKGKNIGVIGEINPKVLENYNLEVPVSGFELNLGKIFENCN